MARKPLVAGNWKMNGSLDFVKVITTELNSVKLDSIDVVVCPPACYLTCFAEHDFLLAGQNSSVFEEGAHTGEISADMLVDCGCDYVILGHSERREEHNESNQVIANKALLSINKGLMPIICIGEPLENREQGTEKDYVQSQLEPILNTLSENDLAKSVIAYEPIWAIGTGKTASPEQAQEMHKFIRQVVATKYKSVAVNIRLLYGGSVKPENAKLLFAQKDIDGGLIGGASLDADSFTAICLAAS